MDQRIVFTHRHWGIPLKVTFNEPAKDQKGWPSFFVFGNPNDFTIYHAVVTQAASLVARLI